MTRKRLILTATGAFFLALALLGTMLFRERVRRRAVFHPSGGAVPPAPIAGIPPVERWTDAFRQASPDELVALLEAIETKHPGLYAKWSLAYLHARALIETDQGPEAAAKLAPFVVPGHPLRDRALVHRAEIEEGDEASRYRQLLIFEHPESPYRDRAIDEELAYLAEEGEPNALLAFVARVAPSAATERRREMSAALVEVLAENGRTGDALGRGLEILRGGTTDDAADRVVRALDRPGILAGLEPAQLLLFSDAFHQHRRFDRAAAVLETSLRTAYSDEMQFDLGRSYFGAEKFEEAEAAYLRGAGATKSPAQKTTFLWHAARAAQLRGDDATAERHMTAAIAVPGRHPSTTPALTQRLRTRLRQGRMAEAASDLALLRKISGGDRALLDGLLAYAVGMVAAKQNDAALAALNAIPPKLAGEHDRIEIAYWRARALEERDPAGAVRAYLEVLRGRPSTFQRFARERLGRQGSGAAALREALRLRDAQVAKLLAGRQFDLARRVETDRLLLSLGDRKAHLQKLASLYGQVPAYRDVLELTPDPFPRFPDVETKDSASLLMAMGLFDEAIPAIESRWALSPAREALTRSHGLQLAGAARQSIFAIEVLMRRVPDDFVFDLLPPLVRDLLYPRYFREFIAEDAESYDVDPRLLFAIMREESRFDPRAKSQAAARGLLQFIITTARDIGREIGLLDLEPDDLYDPRIIIRLGAKYLHELGEELDGNHYRIAAAYNAGPKQVALWTRLQAAPGDDFFVTAINFDETKGYVRKVMSSYERY